MRNEFPKVSSKPESKFSRQYFFASVHTNSTSLIQIEKNYHFHKKPRTNSNYSQEIKYDHQKDEQTEK